MVANMDIFLKILLFFTFSLFLRKVALVNLIVTNFLKFHSKFALFVNPFTSMGHQCPQIPHSIKITISFGRLKNSSIFMLFLETRAHLQSFDTKMVFIRPKLTKIWPFEIWIFLRNKSKKSKGLSTWKSLILRQVSLINLIVTKFLKFPSKFALFVNPFKSMGQQCPANNASY